MLLILIIPENIYRVVLLEVGKEHRPLGIPHSRTLLHSHTLSLPPCWSYLLVLGRVREPLFLMTPKFAELLGPRMLRTCFSIQARRFVRLLCSDITIRGHGLHSAMSRAAMAIARPTCGGVVWLSVLVFQPRLLCWGGVHSTEEGEARPQICSMGAPIFVPRLFIDSALRAAP